eukprot:c15553_g1_i1 orf=3-215(-)
MKDTIIYLAGIKKCQNDIQFSLLQFCMLCMVIRAIVYWQVENSQVSQPSPPLQPWIHLYGYQDLLHIYSGN